MMHPNLEFYEGKDVMSQKDYVKPYGATTATTLWLAQPYHGIGCRAIADSWFGSVKTVVELSKVAVELYSFMLVRTAHKDFPHLLLKESNLERGQWVVYGSKKDGITLQACCFWDLKVKDFISTCATSISGKPRATKHHRLVPQPQVAKHYLKYAVRIDKHNHYWSGSFALKDLWYTKNPHYKQLAGILGFCLANTYLGMKYFSNFNLQHCSPKIAGMFVFTSYKASSIIKTRQLSTSTEAELHTLEKWSN